MKPEQRARWDVLLGEHNAALRLQIDDVTVAAILYEGATKHSKFAVLAPDGKQIVCETWQCELENVVDDAEAALISCGYTLTADGVVPPLKSVG